MAVHSTALIDSKAEIDPDVEVGPYSIIGPGVRIGSGTVLEAHVHIHRDTIIGRNCRFSSFSSIGSDPQDLKYHGEQTRLSIGEHNVFRECVTINRGTASGGGTTTIGNDNLFMAYSHVAHDSLVGSGVIMENAATLAGHVSVSDCATVGAFSAVHQFCRVGPHAFIGGFSVVTRTRCPTSRPSATGTKRRSTASTQ